MSRFNEIAQLYDHRLPQLRSPEIWEQTLRMTSSFWRLNFCEAMLLTLQNPKAEMCGTIDQWNNIGRYIRRGEHSTAVFRSRTDTQLMYLFDVRQTYRESMNLCDECGTFISHFIAENFNNNYLDVKKVTAEATGKYGFERALLMLALRVDSLKYDGRFTADNKEWAQKFLADYPNAEEIRKTSDRTLGTAHPVLLNAVTEELRSAFRERNKQEIEGYRIVQRIRTPNSEFILGQNKKMPGCYATW